MTAIYFIRHGEPNYHNRDDVNRELTDNGIIQSYKLIDVFKDKPIDEFFSSPYKRTIDTIKPTADYFKKEIAIIDEFRERKIGTWVDDFDEFSQRQWQDFEFKLPNGESLKEVQDRNIHALNELLAKYKNHTLVIGTHGTALSTIIHHYQLLWRFWL
ncbi:histidine phosphatase family protein [Moraxella nasovis]|uniref:histidine phosphatase family protein n=1 Tax=Moraxella nasovis TaxID=2904121 RepID=UPI001F600256|nr:histidine phosphatase family protein [Moraxella nasovis]UNU73458.1 histidine phosphatase family protein [Moraxella nasovis]